MVRLFSNIPGWCGFFLVCPWAFAQTTIDLSKPVSESLTPDGIYWTFDQGVVGGSEPEDVEDVSGNGMTGRILPGAVHPKAVYVKGKFGNALGFSGVTPGIEGSDGILRQSRPNARVTWRPGKMSGVGDEVKLDLANGSLTAGIWVKMDAILSGEAQTVFLMHRGAGVGQWAFLLIKDKADAWKINVLGAISTDKTEIFNDGAWHHVAFVREVKDEENIVSFWVDGEQFGSPVVKKNEISPPENGNDRVFTVGERNAANFSTGFSGALDEAFVTSGAHAFKP
ncbi:MAG TPA: hypothetical protein PLS03_08070 [Terrimicrobiaceae bacterium]|nr:hypothetical protein [Terrimicrobiaceae bacterium]